MTVGVGGGAEEEIGCDRKGNLGRGGGAGIVDAWLRMFTAFPLGVITLLFFKAFSILFNMGKMV